MNPEGILFRAVSAYAFLLVLLRLSGKRIVAQATGFDFVLALVVGDLVDEVMLGGVTMTRFAAGAATLVLLRMLASWGSYLSTRFETLVEGPRRVLIHHGVLVRDTLVRERLGEEDAEMLIAQQTGLIRERWPELSSAVIEQNGLPSVVKHDWARAASKEDLERLRRLIR